MLHGRRFIEIGMIFWKEKVSAEIQIKRLYCKFSFSDLSISFILPSWEQTFRIEVMNFFFLSADENK